AVTTGAKSVIINNAAYNSVVAGGGNTNYASGWINGNINRAFTGGSTDTYDFPVGNATSAHLATIKSNGLTGISSFTSYFRALANGNNSQLNAYETSLPKNPYYTPYTSMNTAGAW